MDKKENNKEDSVRQKINKRQIEVLELIDVRQSEIDEKHKEVSELTNKAHLLYLDNPVFGEGGLYLDKEDEDGSHSIFQNLFEGHSELLSEVDEVVSSILLKQQEEAKIFREYGENLISLLLINRDFADIIGRISSDITSNISTESAKDKIQLLLKKVGVDILADDSNVDEITLFLVEYMINSYFSKTLTDYKFKVSDFEKTFARLRQSLGRDKNNKAFHKVLFKRMRKYLIELNIYISNLEYVTESLALNFLTTLAHLERIAMSEKEVAHYIEFLGGKE